MTIRKGEAWGEPAPLPRHGVLAHDDAEVADLVRAARRAGEPVPPVGLLGGDLCRTLGGRGERERLRSADAITFAVDVGEVLLDGEADVFVAHLVARRSFWRGRAVVVMNAPWLGDWNLGPKAHPGDGLLDVSDGHLRLGELLLARTRARQGTHVPHPRITTRRSATADLAFDRALPVRLDGRLRGAFRHVTVRVVPDALRVVV